MNSPLFYVSTSAFNLLGAEAWLGGLQFISTVDAFDGQHPRIFVPEDAQAQAFDSFEAATHYLLTHPAVGERVRQAGPGGRALFLMFDERTEELARQLGLTVGFPPAQLRHRLGSKVHTTQLGEQAGVPSVPHVLARVQSYEGLRQVAGVLGPELVVQLPFGNSGKTTWFISSEEDFLRHAALIAAEPVVKIMRRIRCRQATIEACVTRQGTLVGPLMTELVGFPELTSRRGGWCGNEVFPVSASSVLSAQLRRQALQATRALGERLRREGYWGYFGLDFLIDEDTGALYLGELNPRITGATLLTSLVARRRGEVPLLHFHLLEGLGEAPALDVEGFNASWVEPEGFTGFSQLILEHTASTSAVVSQTVPSGIWRMEPDGSVHFVRREFQPEALAGEDEAFFFRTVHKGETLSEGTVLGRLVVRGRLMTDGYQLNSRAQAWIRGLRARFTP
ncbi:MAG TPA: hypothetical protein VF815_42130 [Myxococcaceae bacterium]|jgi:hypothetical protein